MIPKNNSVKKRSADRTSFFKLFPYLLIAPSLICFFIFYIYPIAYNSFLSFFQWDLISPTKEFVGFANFSTLFDSDEFIQVIKNSLVYMIVSVFLTIAFALPLAIWLNKSSFLHTIIQGLVFTPHIISFVSVSFIWMWMMDVDYGLLNYLLSLIGIDKMTWISHPDTAMMSIILVGVWKLVGYDTLMIIGGLQSIPKSIYESVYMDTRPNLKTFFGITVPLVSPTLFFLAIVNMISSAKVFETVSIMTKGGPVNSTNTLVNYIYRAAFEYFEIGEATAAGVVLFFILLVITILYFWTLSKKINYSFD